MKTGDERDEDSTEAREEGADDARSGRKKRRRSVSSSPSFLKTLYAQSRENFLDMAGAFCGLVEGLPARYPPEIPMSR